MDYKHFGVMLDCSRNAVMRVSEVKRMIDCLVKMGYNTLELYTEDTFVIEGEPYFGYMRGGYTAQEIKEIDAYAIKNGVELIPCVQTLAHFTNLTKLAQYQDIVDTADILLIDEEKTYELIEKIFKTLASNFTSRLVNIGMDEAHMVGLGRYLDKHGYCNRFEILLRHLNRVVDIAKKYGFKPHMWSDMFFRLINNGNYYGKDLRIPQEVVDKMPQDIELTFWDYYHTNKQNYDDMIVSHKQTGKNVWFAGGAWSWAGFAPLNEFSLRSMKPAMQSVNDNGVQNVLITMWGDNGKECSYFALLPALYTIRRYADGESDESKIKQEFFNLFGISYDDFMLLDLPNITPESSKWEHVHTPCKTLLYCDCFLNSNDAHAEQICNIAYEEHARKLSETASRAGEFAYIYNTLSSLCSLLAVKSTISMRARKAYKAGDKEELKVIKKDYERLPQLINDFHHNFFELWEKENKSFGWEVHDMRLGGLSRRVKTCAQKLEKYLLGEISVIEELEVEPLPLTSEPVPVILYNRLVSVSEI